MISVRTRLRKLHTGGRDFVWKAQICHVTGDSDCHRCIRVRVWGAGKNSRALQADLLSKSWGSPWSACAADGAYPAPQDVRSVIDYALTHGWDPDLVGGTVVLSESEHASRFELAGFLLTDRLRDPGAPDPTARVAQAFKRPPAEVEPTTQTSPSRPS